MSAVYRVLTLASPHVSDMVSVGGVKCSLFCNFCFERMNRTLHLCILPSVNALPTLMHSEYSVQKHLYGFNSYSRLITQIAYLTVVHSTKFKLPLADFRWKYIDSLQHWHSQKMFCLPAPHTHLSLFCFIQPWLPSFTLSSAPQLHSSSLDRNKL